MKWKVPAPPGEVKPPFTIFRFFTLQGTHFDPLRLTRSALGSTSGTFENTGCCYTKVHSIRSRRAYFWSVQCGVHELWKPGEQKSPYARGDKQKFSKKERWNAGIAASLMTVHNVLPWFFPNWAQACTWTIIRELEHEANRHKIQLPEILVTDTVQILHQRALWLRSISARYLRKKN